jgi:hypothetical protein
MARPVRTDPHVSNRSRGGSSRVLGGPSLVPIPMRRVGGQLDRGIEAAVFLGTTMALAVVVALALMLPAVAAHAHNSESRVSTQVSKPPIRRARSRPVGPKGRWGRFLDTLDAASDRIPMAVDVY